MNNNSIHKMPDRFDAEIYPDVLREIKGIAHPIACVAGRFKNQIVISFLRDHSIRTDWTVGNDNFVKMVTSGSLKIRYIETLFEVNRGNRKFINDFERYIDIELRNSENDLQHSNIISSRNGVGPRAHERYYRNTERSPLAG